MSNPPFGSGVYVKLAVKVSTLALGVKAGGPTISTLVSVTVPVPSPLNVRSPSTLKLLVKIPLPDVVPGGGNDPPDQFGHGTGCSEPSGWPLFGFISVNWSPE